MNRGIKSAWLRAVVVLVALVLTGCWGGKMRTGSVSLDAGVTANDLHLIMSHAPSGTPSLKITKQVGNPPVTVTRTAAGTVTGDKIDFSFDQITGPATGTVSWQSTYISSRIWEGGWTMDGTTVQQINSTDRVRVGLRTSDEGNGMMSVRLINDGPPLAYSGLVVKNGIDFAFYNEASIVDGIANHGTAVPLAMPESGVMPNGTSLLALFVPTTDPTTCVGGSLTIGGEFMAAAGSVTPGPMPATTYCAPKLNSLGCAPKIYAAGLQSISRQDGYTIGCMNVLGGKPGLLLYGFSGRAATPFQGGLLCVQSPRRGPAMISKTHASLTPCDGYYALDMNAFAQGLAGGTPAPELLEVGRVVDCQWWGRDPGYLPPMNSMLSAAVEYTVAP